MFSIEITIKNNKTYNEKSFCVLTDLGISVSVEIPVLEVPVIRHEISFRIYSY